MRLRDFFEDYYDDKGIYIVHVRHTEMYLLMVYDGGLSYVVYNISKEEANNIIEGKIDKDSIINRNDVALTLLELEECVSEKILQKLKDLDDAEKKQITKVKKDN